MRFSPDLRISRWAAVNFFPRGLRVPRVGRWAQFSRIAVVVPQCRDNKRYRCLDSRRCGFLYVRCNCSCTHVSVLSSCAAPVSHWISEQRSRPNSHPTLWGCCTWHAWKFVISRNMSPSIPLSKYLLFVRKILLSDATERQASAKCEEICVDVIEFR